MTQSRPASSMTMCRYSKDFAAMEIVSRVLVVDDNDAVRDSLKTLLELQSVPVETFETCQEFLALAFEDAVCLGLDIHLHGMSGLDVEEAMRRGKRSLPTILIAARFDDAIRDRARALGAIALLE